MAPRVTATPVVRWPVGAQVSALLPTKQGLWVGGLRGVWSLGRPHKAVANLTVASPQQTRAVVEGGGFIWAIGERIVRMDKRGRLATVVLRQRVLSATWARGALWLGTGDGILRLHPETLALDPFVALGGVTHLWPIERGFWALSEGVPTRIIGRIARPYLVSHPVRDLAPMGGGVCLATDDGLAILFPDGEVLDPLGHTDQGMVVVAVAGDGVGGCWYLSRTGRVGRVSAADEHTSRQLPLEGDARAQRIFADGDWAWVVTDQGTWRIWLKAKSPR
jgi:ligand-binding sensor domain-containing protein